ncbi:transglycosylase SLT domain-containing protein [Streptomyces sp. NPDC050534]|uniref:transglycosylase SLT domain-containing protein n=1 Tax=Streptomyces sp. NPDC050534 TaxID=3365625 RepID=UPI0037AC0276
MQYYIVVSSPSGRGRSAGERWVEMADPSTAVSRPGPDGPGGDDVRTPPLRPGRYDPAEYAECVVRSAEAAGVSPLLVMTVLHNEAYKPHHPLLERLWQWWKPGASFGVANMHRATFEQVRRTYDLPKRWHDLRDDPAFAIQAAALYLKDLDRSLPERHHRRYTRDELLAMGYNAGERNMRAFARGVPPGPMARSYLRRFRAHRSRATAVLAKDGGPRGAAKG